MFNLWESQRPLAFKCSNIMIQIQPMLPIHSRLDAVSSNRLIRHSAHMIKLICSHSCLRRISTMISKRPKLKEIASLEISKAQMYLMLTGLVCARVKISATSTICTLPWQKFRAPFTLQLTLLLRTNMSTKIEHRPITSHSLISAGKLLLITMRILVRLSNLWSLLNVVPKIF